MDELRLEEEAFDAVLLGTGLSHSILAAALAAAGKTVLHLDANAYYGAAGAAFSLKELHAWAAGEAAPAAAAGAAAGREDAREAWPEDLRGAKAVPLREPAAWDGHSPAAVYGPAEEEPVEAAGAVEATAAEEEEEQGEQQQQQQAETKPPKPSALEELLRQSRSYTLDMHPRLMYSRGPLVKLLVQADVAKYVEFRAANDLVVLGEGGLAPVPVSKADVFQDKSMGVAEKRSLMKLTRVLMDDPRRAKTASVEAEEKALEESGPRPFREYLAGRDTPPRVAGFLCYAIALLARSQEAGGDETTSGAVARVRLFLESLGRYGPGSFLFPMYGSSELPQAFCRLAAVRGAIYVLRFGARALLVDGDGDGGAACRGIVTASGQALRARFVVAEPRYASAAAAGDDDDAAAAARPVLSRAVCVVDGPLRSAAGEPLGASAVAVLPPGAAGNAHPVHVLQLDHTTGACPGGRHVLHFTTVHSAGAERDLVGAVAATVRLGGLAASPAVPDGVTRAAGDAAPSASWLAFFTRAEEPATLAETENLVLSRPPPASAFGFAEDVEDARRMFERMYPGEPFLPEPEKPAVKATFFEDDPEGLGSLSSDDEDEDGAAPAPAPAPEASPQAAPEAPAAPSADPLDDLSSDDDDDE